jgi:hypothetical protein
VISDEFKASQQHPTGVVSSVEKIVSLHRNEPQSKILAEETIALLEERLVVNLNRRKVGEIVVRKEVETQVINVQVPIRREKLIVEQIEPEYQLIAEIDLDLDRVEEAVSDTLNRDFKVADNDRNSTSIRLDRSTQPKIFGRIYSLQVASDLLNEIANMPDRDWQSIGIEIAIDNPEHRDAYQALLDRYARS